MSESFSIYRPGKFTNKGLLISCARNQSSLLFKLSTWNRCKQTWTRGSFQRIGLKRSKIVTFSRLVCKGVNSSCFQALLLIRLSPLVVYLSTPYSGSSALFFNGEDRLTLLRSSFLSSMAAVGLGNPLYLFLVWCSKQSPLRRGTRDSGFMG